MLSTAGPLLQRWFGATPHPRAKDPYFLFAAGNTGSLLALLSYPTLVEPRLTLDDQFRLWSWGYVAFVGLVIVCAIVLRRSAARVPAEIPAQQVYAVTPPTLRRRLGWVALAALASSFMLGTTTYLSTDLAPVPLLWVVPLSLYLVTFIVAFALVPPVRSGAVAPAGVAAARAGRPGGPRGDRDSPAAGGPGGHPPRPVHGGGLGGARPASGRPARRRGADRLLHAAGARRCARRSGQRADRSGCVRPFYEYPIAIALAVLLVPSLGGRKTWSERRYGLLGTILLVVAGLAALPAVRLLDDVPAFDSGLTLAALTMLLMGLLGVVGARSPRPYAVGLVLVLVVPLLLTGSLATSRTFFGVQQVAASGGVHTLTNGSTVHGTPDRRVGRQLEPRSYYSRTGPIGQLLADQDERLAGAELGFVGLGSGALAAYGQPDQTITFFEIDQANVDISRNASLFTHLADSAARVEVMLGDGRLSLADEAPGALRPPRARCVQLRRDPGPSADPRGG